MENSQISESMVSSIMESIEGVVRNSLQEAFAAGFITGAERVLNAAQNAVGGPPPKPIIRDRIKATVVGAVVERHPNSADARRFPYGAVANAFREALRGTGIFGLTYKDLVERVSEVLGQDVSNMEHRDTIKRLKKTEQLRMASGRYFAGPGLAVGNKAEALRGASEGSPQGENPEA